MAETRAFGTELKGADYDLIIQVGDVEFKTYRTVMCLASPFIDTALGSSMKESVENRIELPHHNPTEWPMVYKYLDPFKDNILDSVALKELLESSHDSVLMTWFDFLGRNDLVTMMDNFAAAYYGALYSSDSSDDSVDEASADEASVDDEAKYPAYAIWSRYSLCNCPATKAVLSAAAAALGEFRLYEASHTVLLDVKNYLLDDEIGPRLWAALRREVEFPDKMLKDLTLTEIASSSTFVYLLRSLSKLSKPDSQSD